MTREIHPTAQEIGEAIDRIAHTADGAALYVFLQRRLMGVPTEPKAGALRWDHGERSFAAKLISLMAKGIAESGRPGSTGGGTSDEHEQPVVVPSPKPRRVSGTDGTGSGSRRIGPDTIVPGWNDDPGG